jgi:hypothetical protein
MCAIPHVQVSINVIMNSMQERENKKMNRENFKVPGPGGQVLSTPPEEVWVVRSNPSKVQSGSLALQRTIRPHKLILDPPDSTPKALGNEPMPDRQCLS